jgi:hypothetical protein
LLQLFGQMVLQAIGWVRRHARAHIAGSYLKARTRGPARQLRHSKEVHRMANRQTSTR